MRATARWRRIAGWRWWHLPRQAAAGWLANRAASRGAALAYYTALSIAPLLILLTAAAGLAFGKAAAHGAIAAELVELMGEQGATAVEAMIRAAGRTRGTGIAAGIFSGAGLMLGAMAVLGELRAAFNITWRVTPQASRRLCHRLRHRAASLAVILALSFLLLASFAASGALILYAGRLARVAGALPTVLRLIHLALSLGLATLLFALLFRLLPDRRIAWRDVWAGAALTALLFALGKSAIGLYIGLAFGSGRVLSGYGAASAPLIVLLWAYLSAQIVLFGAEITRAVAEIGATTAAPPLGDPETDGRAPAAGPSVDAPR